MPLGGVPGPSGGAGLAQGDPAGKLAFGQRVPDLLEVFAQLVLTECCLNSTGRPPRNEMAAVFLLQVLDLDVEKVKVSYIRNRLRSSVDLWPDL